MSVIANLSNDQLATYASIARSDAAEYGRVAADLERQAAANRELEKESIRHAEYVEHVLAWRQRTGATTGDVFAELEALEPCLERGILRSIQQDEATGQGIGIFTDSEGRSYRVVYSGGVAAFDPDNGYEPVPDEQIVNARIFGALWDGNWLVLGRINSRSLHVRFDGEIDRIEPLVLPPVEPSPDENGDSTCPN